MRSRHWIPTTITVACTEECQRCEGISCCYDGITSTGSKDGSGSGGCKAQQKTSRRYADAGSKQVESTKYKELTPRNEMVKSTTTWK